VTTSSAASRVRYLLGLLAAVALLVAVGVGVSLGVQGYQRDTEWVNHTHENLDEIARLYARTKDAESAQRGYLITGQNDFLGEFYAAKPDLVRRTAALHSSVFDNAAQRQRVDDLAKLIQQRIEAAEAVLAQYEAEGAEAAQRLVRVNNGKQLMREIAELAQAIEAEERRLLGERLAAVGASSLRLEITTLGGIASSILLLCLVFGFILRENRVRLLAERRTEQSSIELANTVMELRRIGNDTDELRRYAGMLQSCRSVEEAMEITGQCFVNLMPDLGGAVYLHRASQNLTESRLRWGEPAADTAPVLHPDDCWALRRGQLYAVPDLGRASKCAHIEAPSGRGAVSTLCLPLAAQGETLGFLYIAGPGRSAVEAEDVAISAAEQLSLALCNLRLQESLRIQSIRDPLSGLFNRRYLEESLEREVVRCERRGLPLAVMMLDVDHFKRFNDAHGHDGGDALLTQFAALLQSMCRGEDIACRFGGEEFTLILPETPPEAAAARAEQIRAGTENLRVMHRKAQLTPVTVSIGVACFPRDGTRGEELIRNADVALYRAKHEGRNRVAGA
jgi:diguanylate cyclase (GGDEF)-like protein